MKEPNVTGAKRFSGLVIAGALLCGCALRADTDVYLLGTPDYNWYAGCFGTASGNLMGYWDRHGMSGFYTNGLAPLNDIGANVAIRSLWANSAHMSDYWEDYQSPASDPFVVFGRGEHTPNCIGDFIGLNQKKWVNMNGECDGNIDGYSFVYWDASGNRRTNYTHIVPPGLPAPDIQSGLRAWTRHVGYEADVFTQLASFNPRTPAGKGFTFEDVKAEINAGYPFLVFLQDYNQYSRSFPGMPRGNPEIHGVVVYGYQEFPDFGISYVRLRTSWASGDEYFRVWSADPWFPLGVNLAVRGVIGYRPKPKVRQIEKNANQITLRWDGPSSQVFDALAQTITSVHRYQVEKRGALASGTWMPVGSPTTSLETTFTNTDTEAFFRVTLVAPGP